MTSTLASRNLTHTFRVDFPLPPAPADEERGGDDEEGGGGGDGDDEEQRQVEVAPRREEHAPHIVLEIGSSLLTTTSLQIEY